MKKTDIKEEKKKTSIRFWSCWINSQPLTLLVAKRLLQHGEDDRVVQHKVTEVAESRGAQSGVANQRVFIQQAAGGGRPAGGGESSQNLHDTGEHRRRTGISRPYLTVIKEQATVKNKALNPDCCDKTRWQKDISWSLTKITLPLQRPWPSWMPGCAPSPLYVGLPAPAETCYQRFRVPQSPKPRPSNPV